MQCLDFGNNICLEIIYSQCLEKSHRTKECLVLMLKKDVRIMLMTRVMLEINSLLRCEAACWFTCCLEWSNSEFWVTNAFFLSWKRESRQVRIDEQIMCAKPWESLDKGFLTQVLEASDHFGRKAQLFYTGKESTWHLYVHLRALHPLSVVRTGLEEMAGR